MFLIVFAGFSNQIFAQCSPAAPAQGVCSGGNGAATDGVNINNGQTYWYTSTGTFQNGININSGGTLRVCGNLTLGLANLNGGTIIIASGGTLTINGGGTLNLNNNVTIANYGTLNINRDVLFQNNGNAIINATTSSVINMANYKMTVSGPNTSSSNILINKGTINLGTLEVTANSDGVCMGNQAVIDTKSYINSKTNAFTVEPGAIAVLRFTQVGANNAPLTATSQLHVCKASGASFSTSGNLGAATLYDNCASSASALPITLRWFQANISGKEVVLTWETAEEKDNDFFEIEHSIDGSHFNIVSEHIESEGDTHTGHRYEWGDAAPAVGVNYYRLKQTDLDGAVHYHGIRSVKTESGSATADVFPNPATDHVSVRFSNPEDALYTISLFDLTGRRLYSIQNNEGRYSLDIDLSALPAGMYALNISSEQMVQTVQVAKR